MCGSLLVVLHPPSSAPRVDFCFACEHLVTSLFIPLFWLLLWNPCSVYITFLTLFNTVDTKQSKPHSLCLFLIPISLLFHLVLVWLLSFTYQYFEGDDLPEATAREIDLLMDQPDQFRRGLSLCISITYCTYLYV